MDDKRAMLLHFLAALAYRSQKALRGAPASFGAFEAGNQAIRRVAGFQIRNGIWNYHSTGYYAGPVINHVYGLNLPVQPAGYGRVFGYTDWLYGD